MAIKPRGYGCTLFFVQATGFCSEEQFHSRLTRRWLSEESGILQQAIREGRCPTCSIYYTSLYFLSFPMLQRQQNRSHLHQCYRCIFFLVHCRSSELLLLMFFSPSKWSQGSMVGFSFLFQWLFSCYCSACPHPVDYYSLFFSKSRI